MNIVETSVAIFAGKKLKLVLGALVLAVLAITIGFAVTMSRFADEQAAEVATRSYQRADIYYVPWNIVTAAGLGPSAVPEAARAKYVVRDGKALARLLKVLQLQYAPLQPTLEHANPLGDYRLVVDLVGVDGNVTTFAANGGQLIRMTDGASRPIDERFRRRFAAGDF